MSDIFAGTGTAPSLALVLARESQLLSRFVAQGNAQASGKIEKAARDFESVLLGHWLEEAQESLAGAPGGSDDDDNDPARSQWQGLGMQSLATAITQSGGIGIAALIERQLQRADAAVATSPQTSARHTQNGPAARGPKTASQPEKSAK